MRVAIIDLGTNSVRFDVHQLSPKKLSKGSSSLVQTRQLHREKLMVRLGQGVFSDGRLNSEAIRRTLNAFKSFEQTARELRATRIVTFGTAALREASDGERLLEVIREQTGIDVRAISGAEEAKLIALGILRNENLPKGKFGLIDIGGGSTEISVCGGRDMLLGDSFPLGTAKLQQVFLRTSPPRPLPHSNEDPIVQLRRYIRSALLPKMIAQEWPKVDRLIGSSGTIRALIRLTRPTKDGKTSKKKKKKAPRSMSRDELRKLVKAMSQMTTTELLSYPGMEAKRVDMILAGAILLEECMIALKAKKIQATEYSLRDGILEEQIELLKREKISSGGLPLEELVDRVSKPRSTSPEHLAEISRLAGEIFDLTRKVHRLPAQWKSYLQAAAILRDIGQIISPSHYEEHSYYFVKHMDTFVTESWETEFVAQLCLWHRAGKPGAAFNFGKENLAKRDAFKKLLALLRMADALERPHQNQLKLKAFSMQGKDAVLLIGGNTTPDLELLRAEQKKGLFEEVFKKSLRVVYRRSGR